MLMHPLAQVINFLTRYPDGSSSATCTIRLRTNLSKMLANVTVSPCKCWSTKKNYLVSYALISQESVIAVTSFNSNDVGPSRAAIVARASRDEYSGSSLRTCAAAWQFKHRLGNGRCRWVLGVAFSTLHARTCGQKQGNSRRPWTRTLRSRPGGKGKIRPKIITRPVRSFEVNDRDACVTHSMLLLQRIGPDFHSNGVLLFS